MRARDRAASKRRINPRLINELRKKSACSWNTRRDTRSTACGTDRAIYLPAAPWLTIFAGLARRGWRQLTRTRETFDVR